ncbi:MAG: S8 family serine peptidase [candidate division Zixibacteria bacterium]|nr:S8 family serine peptidase [candidate division Zixibacteria bacterium]
MSWAIPLMYPPPGRAGIDFKEDQLIVRLKHGYINIPDRNGIVSLFTCEIDDSLLTILTANRVEAVEQVFKGASPGDTLRTVNGSVITVPDLSQVFLFHTQSGCNILDAIQAIYNHDAVLYAEPNHMGAILTATPDDDSFSVQWGIRDPDSFGIGCPDAWEYTTGDSTVKIAIIDGGIEYTHKDLGGFEGQDTTEFNCKVVGGWDYDETGTGDSVPYPSPARNHGTNCAGIAAAITNDDYGMAGIAGGWWDEEDTCNVGAKLYSMKVSVGSAGAALLARVIRESADPDKFGCNILSNSWGFKQYNETLREGVLFAYYVGASFVASKSHAANQPNEHPWRFYPGDYDYSWVTSVGAYGKDGKICRDNSYCTDVWSNYGYGIDILAPGYDILTTDNERNPNLDEFYRFLGTSAAVPHAAGSIALIRSIETNLRNEDTDWILKFSSWDERADSNEWTWQAEYGHGDLRINTAVERLDSLYELYSHTATGGYYVGSPGTQEDYTFIRSSYIFPSDTLLNGDYRAIVYDVRVDVTYSESFHGPPYVWGVGYGSVGWSAANPNYQVSYCRAILSSATSTGCQLQTYVFKVYDKDSGNFLGWYPCKPEDVSLKYKVWGEPSIPRFSPLNEDDNGPPYEFQLIGNHPNPFNSTTGIKFQISEKAIVSLSIFNLLGQKVITLVNREIPGGAHSIIWDGKNDAGVKVASGIYFSKLSVYGRDSIDRLTLIK